MEKYFIRYAKINKSRKIIRKKRIGKTGKLFDLKKLTYEYKE